MFCTYRAISTATVKVTPPVRNEAANVANRLRSKNRLNGMIGFLAVRSTKMNATKAARATRPEPIVAADCQPSSGPVEKPKTAAVQANVASTAPPASSFIRSFSVSCSAGGFLEGNGAVGGAGGAAAVSSGNGGNGGNGGAAGYFNLGGVTDFQAHPANGGNGGNS